MKCDTCEGIGRLGIDGPLCPDCKGGCWVCDECGDPLEADPDRREDLCPDCREDLDALDELDDEDYCEECGVELAPLGNTDGLCADCRADLDDDNADDDCPICGVACTCCPECESNPCACCLDDEDDDEGKEDDNA